MKRGGEWESVSLRWIHEVRESQYRATRGLPLTVWLKPVDAKKAARAARRMGLKVRVREATRRPGARPARTGASRV